MTSFKDVPLFDSLVQSEPPYPEAQNFVTKNSSSCRSISWL